MGEGPSMVGCWTIKLLQILWVTDRNSTLNLYGAMAISFSAQP